MAAIDLPGHPFPSIKRTTGVTTALQAFVLPSGVRKVTIKATAAVWVQFTGADGDAVDATASVPVAADSAAEFALNTQPPTSVFVAAQSGTATVVVICEGAL